MTSNNSASNGLKLQRIGGLKKSFINKISRGEGFWVIGIRYWGIKVMSVGNR